MNGLIRLDAAGLCYGDGASAVWALRDVNLQLTAGERVALIGGNGCGKSSLLRLLHGLVRPTVGRRMQADGLRLAMLFQRPQLLRLSVWTNLTLGLWLAGQPWRRARETARAALARFGLQDLALRSGRALSGGQLQRVALARAWALAPQVLLLDEPTSSLDRHAKREVEQHIAEWAARTPAVTLGFASHNLGQVKRLATRVLYLEQGRLLADLPAEDFFNRERLARQCPAAHHFVTGELP
ncbi:MAG: ATP-binding cassette domain-containing protein [Rhodoferax sp.]|nr:ATP-binding cassette domain-containing protein [Rhodoferax sp.]